MRFSTGKFTAAGPRLTNEDSVGVWNLGEGSIALAVADGLGGLLGGAVASSYAIEHFGEAVENNPNADLSEILYGIHLGIRKRQEENDDLRSMATTFTAAVIMDRYLRGVHCGDTRLALSRGGGIIRLTEDQTEAQRLLTSGQLTTQEFKNYPRKNILDSALGIKSRPQIDTYEQIIEPGDRIILTSDGFHSKIYIREFKKILDSYSDPQKMVEFAAEIVGERKPDDNYSLVACYVDP